MEAVLSEGGPWNETKRIVDGAIRKLNDYIGYRPIAVLEGKRHQAYPHEWVRPIPLYIENVGVAPDYDVTLYPKDVIAGKDAQLDKAIELALEALKKNPPKKDVRPEYPKRVLPPQP